MEGRTLGGYAHQWLGELILKPRSIKRYESIVRTHILPELGAVEIGSVSRSTVKSFLARKLKANLSVSTVRYIATILRQILNAAVDENLIEYNPVERVIRNMRLTRRARAEALCRMRALTLEQLQSFIGQAKTKERYYYPFATLAWTGMRLGELRALKPSDVDFPNLRIHITKSVSSRSQLGTTKAGNPRAVDIPNVLADELRAYLGSVRPELARRWGVGSPPWLFFSKQGNPLNERQFEIVFKRIAEAAGLSQEHTPHDLRHTYASILLQRGEPIQYVSMQLGHSSIALTNDVYGRWLRPHRSKGIEALAEQSSPRKHPCRIILFRKPPENSKFAGGEG